MADTVEPEFPNSKLTSDALRNRISVRVCGDCGMECRVEHNRLRNIRILRPAFLNNLDYRRIVYRGKVFYALQRLDVCVGDDGIRREFISAVDETVCDNVGRNNDFLQDGFHHFGKRFLVSAYPHAPDALPIRVAMDYPRRLRRFCADPLDFTADYFFLRRHGDQPVFQ